MTEKKTAEEIVNKNDIDKGPPHWLTKKSAIKSCEEYAAQELAEYKSAIKELIPIAEDRLFAVPVKSLEGVQEVIERARKLIKL